MDIQKLIDGIKALIELMFGGQPPAWVLPSIAWILAIGIALYALVFLLAQVKRLWNEFLKPIFYNPEERVQRLHRQRFAEHIESEIKRLNLLEAWHDYRFAELEAEVEAEGQILWFGQFQLPWSGQGQLRREKSLSKALEKSKERLILLEGEPGSGKSVALRHVAQQMANGASKSRDLKSIIPIYINLKELRRSHNQEINRDFIKMFIRRTLNRINDRDIEEFLDQEFEKGLIEGTWVFLFDSFDEIPEVLSSTEADETIRIYAEAIRDFLHGMNHCRGVVASREYRGPRRLGWPRFRILQLSAQRREELVKKTGLSKKLQETIFAGIISTSSDFGVMANNPMFLGLLCEYVRNKSSPTFPEHTYSVFEAYIQHRLSRDTERIQRRFGKTPAEIRNAAEVFAYCMTSDPELGLSPAREQLHQSTLRAKLSLDPDFDISADALEFLKLARAESMVNPAESKGFTFAHRRFQEYFATTVVMHEPGRIPPIELLTNARWRETTVVLLQTQSPESIAPILSAAQDFLITWGIELDVDLRMGELRKRLSHFSETEQKPPVSIWQKHLPYTYGLITKSIDSSRSFLQFLVEGAQQRMQEKKQPGQPSEEHFRKPNLISWPKSLFHVLGILQDGLINRRNLISEDLEFVIDELLTFFSFWGTHADEKWCLQVAGAASQFKLSGLITHGFLSDSLWLRDAAYRQVSKLGKVPAAISDKIIEQIMTMAFEGHLFSRRKDTVIHLSRITNPSKYLNVLRLMILAPIIDYVLSTIGIIAIWKQTPISGLLAFLALILVVIRWRVRFVTDIFGIRISPFMYYFFVVLPSFLLSFLGLMSTFWYGTAGIIYYATTVWAPVSLHLTYTKSDRTHPIYWPIFPLRPLYKLFSFMAQTILRLPLFILAFPFIVLICIWILLAGIFEFVVSDQKEIRQYLKAYFRNLNIISVLKTISRNLHFYLRQTVNVTNIIIIIPGLVFFYFLFFQTHALAETILTINNSPLGSFIQHLGLWWVPLLLLVLAMLLHNEFAIIFNWYRKYQKWIKEGNNKVSLVELVQVLGEFNLPQFRIRILRMTREKQLLEVTKSSEADLRCLVLFVETVLNPFL